MRRDSKAERTRAPGCDARTPEARPGDATPPAEPLAGQAPAALNPIKTLAEPDLMERVLERGNLNRAYQKVKANKGAPGVDGMTVQQALGWLKTNQGELLARLAAGTYVPQPVRAVDIPKAGGGTRRLGIPTVVDRVIQQALLQVLQPDYDACFTASSFGFRPGKSAIQAVEQGARYVREGRTIVVDIDLEKFFDRVNHDKLMGLLAKDIQDKRVLKLIRAYLETGMFVGGILTTRSEGTPQGGPLSPLLANVLLNELDQELEARGHCYCRYADDCNIYVGSLEAGKRVMEGITRFIEDKLKLKVNRDKSAVAEVGTRKFLGYQITEQGRLTIAPASIKKLKERVKETTRRNRGASFGEVIGELKRYLPGWGGYFRAIDSPQPLQRLDSWIRRKLRCYRLKQTKGGAGLRRFLTGQGVTPKRARQFASSGRGWWRLSRSPPASVAMPNRWFESLGLPSLERRYYAMRG